MFFDAVGGFLGDLWGGLEGLFSGISEAAPNLLSILKLVGEGANIAGGLMGGGQETPEGPYGGGMGAATSFAPPTAQGGRSFSAQDISGAKADLASRGLADISNAGLADALGITEEELEQLLAKFDMDLGGE